MADFAGVQGFPAQASCDLHHGEGAYQKYGTTRGNRGEPGMISVQIAISKLSQAGLTAYLSERRDPRLIIKYTALDILSYRSLAVLDGFISGRA